MAAHLTHWSLIPWPPHSTDLCFYPPHGSCSRYAHDRVITSSCSVSEVYILGIHSCLITFPSFMSMDAMMHHYTPLRPPQPSPPPSPYRTHLFKTQSSYNQPHLNSAAAPKQKHRNGTGLRPGCSQATAPPYFSK